MVVIINTIVSILGILPSFAVQMATVMGGASPGAGDWGARIAMAGLIFPAMPIISIIGSWIAFLLGVSWLAIGFVALPWVYLLALGVGLVIFFGKPKEQ